MPLDLVTHNEILIEAPAKSVWPRLLDLNAWKKGPELVHAEGPINAWGEVFAATDRISKAVLYFAKVVELVPPECRTIKLFRDHEVNLLGFASWQLRERDGLTTVVYDVYAQFEAPSDKACKRPEAVYEELEDSRQLEERARFQEELKQLKKLVAGVRPPRA
ncbi:MAG: hypothetical protein ACREVV_11530 [Steroidobacteraceae bacterium]